MEKIFEKYCEFMLIQLMHDIPIFNNWWMLLILPAIFFFCFLMLKYTIMLLPIIIPLRILGTIFTDLFRVKHIHQTFNTNEKQNKDE